MTENIPALIAEARDVGDKRRKMWPTPPVMSALIRRLSDALESTVKEMHARELHHFEAEQAMREALELIQPSRLMVPTDMGYEATTRDVIQARAILIRALNENGVTDG